MRERELCSYFHGPVTGPQLSLNMNGEHGKVQTKTFESENVEIKELSKRPNSILPLAFTSYDVRNLTLIKSRPIITIP